MTTPKGLGKNVFIGGLACGLISLIPIVNFLNLLLMMWMGVGGFVTIYLLKKENTDLTSGDAALAGGLSGLFGGLVFSITSAWVLLNIPMEKVEKIISLVSILFPNTQGETDEFFQGPQFRVLILIVLSAAVLISVLAGMVGGIIARKISTQTDLRLQPQIREDDNGPK
jgi:hypothetical protein